MVTIVCVCVCVVRRVKIYPLNKLQVYNTVLLNIITHVIFVRIK